MFTLSNNTTQKPFWKKEYKNFYPDTQPVQSYLQNNTILKYQFEKCNSYTFKVEQKEDLPTKIKSLKLKLNPNKDQKIQLNQWAGCVRFLYNKTIACLTNPKNTTLRHKYKLRSRFATVINQETKKQNSFYNNKPWLSECLSSVRKYAIYQAEENLRSCFTNLKEGNITQFDAPYRTKKKEQSNGFSYTIEKQDIHKQGNKLYISNIGEIKYFCTKQLHKLIPSLKEQKSQNKKKEVIYKPAFDCKIQKTAFDEYFLIVPYVCKQKSKPKNIFKNPISLDPGVRKVLTSYNPNNKESLIFGKDYTTEMMKLFIQLDKMYSTNEDKTKIKRLRKRIFYLKKEFRNQTAAYISKNHDLVLMPKLDTKKLVLKATRRLKTKTVRNMLSIGHSLLFESLKDKCWENGCYFLHVEEFYTSQTCPRCGSLHKTASETYTCKKCNYTQDRDINGAVNIFLKALSA